ncbi:hypothetical protein F4775DRAFT_553434 [Biscogniauxia sp. FL1348]|nr:hypothetical protein F4775DRAFT_553434 [Biscogniauxia sp. FL1348]
MRIPSPSPPLFLLGQLPICRGVRGTFLAQRQLVAARPARAINIFSLFQSSKTPIAPKNTGVTVEPSDEMMLHRHNQLLRRRPEEQELTDIAAAPIFTYPVMKHTEQLARDSSQKPFTQYALFGADAQTLQHSPDQDSRMLYNVATPTSFFICGSQGSGKSHTLSCILENCLIPSESLGRLPKPLTGIVFHYDNYLSDAGGSPCEAAYLSSDPRVKVRVLCSPSNISNIKNTYSSFDNITVEELRLDESDLNTKRMLDLMSFDKNPPLYMHTVQRVLREMRIYQQKKGTSFSYEAFIRNLNDAKLDGSQSSALRQRLENLETFMLPQQIGSHKVNLVKKKKQPQQPKSGKKKAKKEKPVEELEIEDVFEELESKMARGTDWTLKAGELIIVDLSCPTITSAAASSLFNICLSIFLAQETSIGRVVALDEAHKYMDQTSDSAALTNTLLSTIRLQRHLGVRVVISTQEPTISPKLLDLSSIAIIHRFTSPDWFSALKKHLAGVALLSKITNMIERPQQSGSLDEETPISLNVETSSNELASQLFARIVTLKTGEALVFAPNAVVGLEEEVCPKKGTRTTHKRLAQDAIHVLVRSRITADGGKSIMAS